MADHKQAQDYTALGPSGAGFKTQGARIQTGVVATGVQVGVEARGGTDSDGGIGVSALAVGGGIGVQGIGVNGTGVSGDSRADDGIGGIGVLGSSNGAKGIGVLGSGGEVGVRASGTRGGEFSGAPDGAAINLAAVELPYQKPPKTGRAGDLYVISARPDPDERARFPEGDDPHLAQLWFCLRGDDPANPAIWGRVQFSEFRP